MRRLDVPRVFVDETSTKILLATLRHPRTGVEVSRITGVPVAETFYRLRVLEMKGLVGAVHHILADGRSVAVFHANLSDAYVFVEGNKVKVRFSLASYEEADHWEERAALL